MAKVVYLKVDLADGVPVLVGESEQKGELVVCRGEYSLTPGEIWATDGLVERKGGYYATGKHLYKITDEDGIALSADEAENDVHLDMLNSYTLYTTVEPEPKKKDPTKKSLMEKLRFDNKLKPPTIEDDGWYVDEGLWYHLLRCLMKKKRLLLTGESGSGKTELVSFVANSLKKNLEIFDMAVSNPNKTFCGNLRAEDGSTYFQLARFAKSIQKQGIILMDELSRAAPTANNIFLPVLDSRATLYIEEAIREEDIEVRVHPECCFWATANIGAKFIGTQTLDHALMNRFSMVPVHYPPQAKETELLVKRCGVDQRTASTLVAIANNIRNHPDLTKDISTRQLLELAEACADGYNIVDAFTWHALSQYEGDSVDGGERTTVMGIISAT